VAAAEAEETAAIVGCGGAGEAEGEGEEEGEGGRSGTTILLVISY